MKLTTLILPSDDRITIIRADRPDDEDAYESMFASANEEADEVDEADDDDADDDEDDDNDDNDNDDE